MRGRENKKGRKEPKKKKGKTFVAGDESRVGMRARPQCCRAALCCLEMGPVEMV